MEETKVVPKALEYLVQEYNRRLQEVQDGYTAKIVEASMELMLAMGISPETGWQMDLDRMLYVRTRPDPTSPVGTTEPHAPIVE